MTFQETAGEVLRTARFITTTYLSDLSDADLLVAPVEGAHHAAWQLGHLIASESRMVGGVKSGAGIELSGDFQLIHGKESPHEQLTGFLRVSDYKELLEKQRFQTLQLLSSLSEKELGLPAPEFMRAYAPTISSVFLSIASHELMHAGQIAVIRRRLHKPVLI